MKCLDFRRRILEDPYTNQADLVQHEDNCKACAAYVRNIRIQEACLRTTMSSIPVPPELADKVRLKVGLKKSRIFPLLAAIIVASIFLLLALVSIGDFAPEPVVISPQHTLSGTQKLSPYACE